MGQTIVHEAIEVDAYFTKEHVVPRAFRWAGRIYRIDSINQRWTGHTGGIKLYYFAVSSGGNAYKLCYNSAMLSWTLEEVYTEF